MLTPAEYRRLTLRQMQARRWRTTRAIQTYGQRIAAGAEVKVVAKRGGLTLETAECRHCGVRFRARKVHPSGVEEFEGD